MIAEKSGADALFIIEYGGFRKTGGKIAQETTANVLLALLTGSYAIPVPEGSAVEVALIDMVSGDVLWTNILSHTALDAKGFDVAMDVLPHDVDPSMAENNDQAINDEGVQD